jgi:hypothetical protein
MRRRVPILIALCLALLLVEPILDLLLRAVFVSLFYLARVLEVTHFPFVLLAST